MQFSNPFLGQRAKCSCGREHEIPIDAIFVDESIEDALLQYVRETASNDVRNAAPDKVLVVCDSNTYEVMGRKVCSWLDSNTICNQCFVFEDAQHLLPDEYAIAKVRKEIEDQQVGQVIAVGSGVLNDIVRYASFKQELPYSVVATAPSMDGYASSVAALQFDGLKTTLPAHSPKAIFAEADVLANAPFELRQSGFGDLIGKLISLMDWKLSHHLYGEYFCETSYEMVREPLEYCASHANDLKNGDKAATMQLFAGLINAGLAMAMMGNSRPCSGSEHHCSHYWDLMAFHERRDHKSHGLQVGYSTSWMIRFYRSLKDLTTIAPPIVPTLTEDYQRELVGVYGEDGVNPIYDVIRAKHAFQSQRNRYDEWTMEALIESLEPEWSMIEKVESALFAMGISDQMQFLELNEEMLQETFLHANELRERFTIFDFLKSQQRLKSAIERVISSAKIE